MDRFIPLPPPPPPPPPPAGAMDRFIPHAFRPHRDPHRDFIRMRFVRIAISYWYIHKLCSGDSWYEVFVMTRLGAICMRRFQERFCNAPLPNEDPNDVALPLAPGPDVPFLLVDSRDIRWEWKPVEGIWWAHGR